MDHIGDHNQMLNMLPCPAFTARDGMILCCNDQARRLLLEPGTHLDPLMASGSEELAALKEGDDLYLSMTVMDIAWCAHVSPLSDCSLFRLERSGETPELKAMSLLGSQLRLLLGDLTLQIRRLPDDGSETGTSVRRELCRVSRLLNNISSAQRFVLDDGSHRTEQDICAVMEELLTECAALLKEANLQLHYTVPQRAVYTAMDWDMLRQAVYAMVDNAAKHTPAGGSIRAELTASRKSIRLTVTDPGSGIAPEVRGSLFSRYTRQPGIEDGTQELGLGMLLIRTAAISHGGTVLVDSNDDTGTRVSMTVAIQAPREHQLRTHSSFTFPTYDDGLVMLSNVLPAKLYKNK